MGNSVDLRCAFHYSGSLGGGDFAEVVPLSPHLLAFYLVDVTGHGDAVQGFCPLIRAYMRAVLCTGVSPLPPEALLQCMNQDLCSRGHGLSTFAIWFAVFDSERRILRYSSAGHPPAYLMEPVRRSVGLRFWERSRPARESLTARALSCRTPAIGMVPDLRFRGADVAVHHGSRLYLFSDGLYECADAPDDWNLTALVDLLRERDGEAARGGRPADPSALMQEVEGRMGRAGFDDDVSLLTLHFP
ncbi:serine/threonine-protein phosphatase [Synechococcus sp. RSCCF101]|nr:serine/threonine-protein phosphatase [Synechococcus sp. RSCCF101]